MLGMGHYWCGSCGHAVYAQFGGCRSCRTPLMDLILLDEAIELGYADMAFGIPFDPYAGGFGFGMGFGPEVIIEEPVVIIEDDVFVDDGYTDGGYDSNYGDGFGGGDF